MPKTHVDLARLLAPDVRRTAEMQALHDRLVREDGGLPDWLALPVAEARAQAARVNRRWNQHLPAIASVTPLTVPGRGEAVDIPAQMIVPPDVRPGCILFLHGGGWAFCDLETHQGLMRRLAIAARTRVLAIEYRLAPENPYPAPLDDCVAAWRWLHAQAGAAPELDGPLAVAGDSAGANLSIATLLHEVACDRPLPDGGLLFYGAYTFDLDSPSCLRFAEGYGLTRARIERFYDWYAPVGKRQDPLVCPVKATTQELAKLPPLFLNAAGLDPLLCETLDMLERLDAGGAAYEFVLHEGVHHGFMMMGDFLAAARDAIRQAADFFGRLPRTQSRRAAPSGEAAAAGGG